MPLVRAALGLLPGDPHGAGAANGAANGSGSGVTDARPPAARLKGVVVNVNFPIGQGQMLQGMYLARQVRAGAAAGKGAIFVLGGVPIPGGSPPVWRGMGRHLFVHGTVMCSFLFSGLVLHAVACGGSRAGSLRHPPRPKRSAPSLPPLPPSTRRASRACSPPSRR